MSVTEPRFSRRTANATLGQRLVSRISILTVGPASPRREWVLGFGLLISAEGLLVLLLWRALPRFELVRAAGGSAQHLALPLSSSCAALLGLLLAVSGGGTLLASQLGRRAARRRTTAGNRCPRRLTRMASVVGEGVRRRGAYAFWPVHQPGRLLYGRCAQSRRTVTRGYHGDLHRLRGYHGDLHRVRGRHGDVSHHAHVEPVAGAARAHGLPGGRRRPGGGGLALLSEARVVECAGRARRPGVGAPFKAAVGRFMVALAAVFPVRLRRSSAVRAQGR